MDSAALSISIPLFTPAAGRLSSSVNRILRPLRVFFPLKKLTIAASASRNPPSKQLGGVDLSPIKTALVCAVVAAASFGKLSRSPVRAEVPPPASETATAETLRNSPLARLLESNPESAAAALKNLLQEKLEAGEDEESLSILTKLTSAQPDNLEWKFLTARLLSEMGKSQEARSTFEEILSRNPLSFEALFENALLMDSSGERESVLGRLEEALRIAENDKKPREARDVKLIMAQMQFLQKNVDGALRSYDELAKEDPSDFRPYLCKGMILSLSDRKDEAEEEFAKYRELSPEKFEVEGYLRTPLSKRTFFRTQE
ncbi:hypothetical protein M569_09382 [Genlisea aurea]|uniref:Uncharacterized protein n=1 Tax=Genlisea aurea TaxID=192259 RepID=S8CL14_9LAMI|nr:hypothetical protein M569_09382 [Genlisea aurea]